MKLGTLFNNNGLFVIPYPYFYKLDIQNKSNEMVKYKAIELSNVLFTIAISKIKGQILCIDYNNILGLNINRSNSIHKIFGGKGVDLDAAQYVLCPMDDIWTLIFIPKFHNRNFTPNSDELLLANCNIEELGKSIKIPQVYIPLNQVINLTISGKLDNKKVEINDSCSIYK